MNFKNPIGSFLGWKDCLTSGKLGFGQGYGLGGYVIYPRRYHEKNLFSLKNIFVISFMKNYVCTSYWV